MLLTKSILAFAYTVDVEIWKLFSSFGSISWQERN